MTVSSTINREQYATNGVTTAFTIHFPFFNDTDVNAIFVDAMGDATALTLNTDFTVSGGGGTGGSLVATTAPAGGGTLTIYRDIPFTQEDDYVEDDPLPADTLEGGFDRAAMRDQQLKDGQERALSFPVTVAPDVLAELPTPSADQFLGWASDGKSIVNRTIAGVGVVVKATNGQAVAGSNDTDYMTPATTKATLQGAEYDTGSVSTAAGAAEGPTDEIYRNKTGAAADLGGVRSWAMKSAAGTKRVVGKILSRLVTATDTTEGAALDIYTRILGVLARRFSIGAGLYASGLNDMGAGTVNATAVYVNGATVGKIVSCGYAQYTANADLTTALPCDDTAPQITEGTQILSLSMTTITASQVVDIDVGGVIAWTGSTQMGMTVWRDSTCVFSAFIGPALGAAAAGQSFIGGRFRDSPASAGAYTYTVRVGSNAGGAGSCRMNGTVSGRLGNGTAKSTITATVIEP
jgi:hypothetical protein